MSERAMDEMRTVDAVAVRLTAAGMGAIGVVQISGKDARGIVRGLAKSGRVEGVAVGGFVKSGLVEGVGEGAVAIDEALVVRTGEEKWELHVHGGVAVMEMLMRALGRAGARLVGVEEAVGMCEDGEVGLALARAKTGTGVGVLLRQEEAWRKWVERWKDVKELWRVQAEVQWVLERSRALAWLLTPPRVALVGAPNVGKSTLANALLGRRVSITSDIAGTTRDWVDAEAVFRVEGKEAVEVAVNLVDTAGVRETSDVLEEESIRRTHGQVAEADVVVVVVLDATRAVTGKEVAMVEKYAGHGVIVVNKVDVVGEVGAALRGSSAVSVSAKTGVGLEELMRRVLGRLDVVEVGEEEVFAFNERRRGLLEKLAHEIDIHACVHLLQEI